MFSRDVPNTGANLNVQASQQITSPQTTVAASSPDVSIQDYLELLRRRRVIFIQTLVVVIALGAVVTVMTKPLYNAHTSLLVEGRANTVAQMTTSDPLGNLFLPDVGHDIQTQVEVLNGEKVLAEAYRSANVSGDAAKVYAKEVSGTDVIDIDVESTNAGYAESLAKTMPDAYMEYVTGNRKNELADALAYATNALTKEQTKLNEAETALEKFKEKHGIATVEIDNSQRTNMVQSAAVTAKSADVELSSNTARLRELLAAFAKEPVFVENPTTVSNPQIGGLQDRLILLRNERAGLIPKYKPTSVEIMRIDSQISDLERRLAVAPPMVTTQMRVVNPRRTALLEKIAETRSALAANEASVLKARELEAKDSEKIRRYGSLERQQADLQRAVTQGQAVVAQLANSVLQLNLRTKGIHKPGRIIAGPTKAIQVAPKPLQNMLYATGIGIVLAICFALLQEFLDDRIHTPEEARRHLNVPILGYIPLVEKEEGRLLSRARGMGPLLESYRVLRSNVQFATVDNPASALLVTSSVPGEGKSTTASNLAVAMALDGRRVILVDCDLRLPTLHEKFQVKAAPGLTNVMLGSASLDEALQETTIPKLRLLTAGPLPPNPAELLNSHTMQQVFAALKSKSDVVIFDSPPCLSAADAQVLSAAVDGVIYVMQFGEARKSGVRHAGELLLQAQARVLGVVFNKISHSDHRDNYYFSSYGNYSNAQGGAPIKMSEFEALLQKNAENGAETKNLAEMAGAAKGDGDNA